MERIRAFIAIELPIEIKDALAAAQHELQRADAGAARGVRWVAPGSIHLTLKFLGDTPTDKVEAIRQAIVQAAGNMAPIALRLGGVGCFPNPRQPRVLWVGLEGDLAALSRLQAAIESTVSPLGFPSEKRPFSPHLTLGRVRDDATPDHRRRLAAAISTLRPSTAHFTATAVSLMRSDLRPEGAVYTRLAEVELSSKQ